MLGDGDWHLSHGETKTGIEDVDLWVGGLAEATSLNGGMLGSTFSYVFEKQLTDLQDGDRFYYLNRTAGMNLLSQLEGNSFAEMIQRNTDGTRALKADAFSTVDCRFDLAHLEGTPDGFAHDGADVADDPTTECNEHLLLQRRPDGTIAYRATNSVDPSGINAQAVYDGTSGNDRVSGGTDDDTFWGGAGNDTIEGNSGHDVALGGDGDDVVTDLDGADTLKGGPGDDAIDGGPGLDLLVGGDGQDVINGGVGGNLIFGGPDTDFVIAGDGTDTAQGDGGDDWVQGGKGADALVGDHDAPYFDDPGQVTPGNDVLVGQAGNNKYDAEGGDDVMSSSGAVDAFGGFGGFDWATHQYDTVAADDDLNINRTQAKNPPSVVNRDSWQETEAVSGSSFDDVIRGDDTVPSTLGGRGYTGCDVLDKAGVDRIARSRGPAAAGLHDAGRAGRRCLAGRLLPGQRPGLGSRQHPARRRRQRHSGRPRRRRHHRRRPCVDGADQPAHRPVRPRHRDRVHGPDGAPVHRPLRRRPPRDDRSSRRSSQGWWIPGTWSSSGRSTTRRRPTARWTPRCSPTCAPTTTASPTAS